jgi:drug/metabolite transporter (DMT)-like permease
VSAGRARAPIARKPRTSACGQMWLSVFRLSSGVQRSGVVKGALSDVSPLLYLALRFGLAAIVMGALFRRSLGELDRANAPAAVGIGFFMFGGYAFQIIGLKFTTASKTAFITGSSVVLVPILLGIFGRRRLNVLIWAGALAALAGLYFLTVPLEGLGGLNRGDLVVFGCAAMFALRIISVGRYARRYSVGAFSLLQVATTAGLAFLALPLFAAAGW